MSQVSDVSLANQGFSAFRTELNNILGALNTAHIGSSAPSSVAQGTIWVDSGTSGFLKIKIKFLGSAQTRPESAQYVCQFRLCLSSFEARGGS